MKRVSQHTFDSVYLLWSTEVGWDDNEGGVGEILIVIYGDNNLQRYKQRKIFKGLLKWISKYPIWVICPLWKITSPSEYEPNEKVKDENISDLKYYPLNRLFSLISINQLEDKTQPSNHVMMKMTRDSWEFHKAASIAMKKFLNTYRETCTWYEIMHLF